jgi:hypothetical protein
MMARRQRGEEDVRAVVRGTGQLDPRPRIGMVVGLDGVPDAIELARKAQGPPRIVVRP